MLQVGRLRAFSQLSDSSGPASDSGLQAPGCIPPPPEAETRVDCTTAAHPPCCSGLTSLPLSPRVHCWSNHHCQPQVFLSISIIRKCLRSIKCDNQVTKQDVEHDPSSLKKVEIYMCVYIYAHTHVFIICIVLKRNTHILQC